jgi:hypothetical protein
MIYFLHCETVAVEPTNYLDSDAGSRENPFLISDLSNLRWFSENRGIWGSETKSYFFLQTADIDATESRSWNDGLGFSPIGYLTITTSGESIYPYQNAFRGSYDGGGFAIRNVYMSTKAGDNHHYVGFFGVMTNSTVTSLHLENILYIFERTQAGAFVHTMQNSTITNSSISGTIVLADLFAESVIGKTVTGPSNVSGFAYLCTNSTIESSYSTVNIINVNNRNTTTGLVESLVDSSVLSNSFYQGMIHNPSPTSSAGLVNFVSNSEVKNVLAIVNANIKIYGITTLPNDGSVSNSYFLRTAKVRRPFALTFLRFMPERLKRGFIAGEYRGRGVSEKKLKSEKTFRGWDFTNIWNIDPEVNNGFPHLRKAFRNI